MYLQQIKFVDLKTSKWDRAKSNPAAGEYFFTDKRYINYRGDRAAAPPFKFMWNRYNPKSNFREIEDWKIQYKASFVTPEDPYWPEGIPPQNGIYLNGDSVLMKIPIMEYARKRKAEIDQSESRSESAKRAFYNELRGYGLPDDEGLIDKLVAGRMS